MSQAAIGSAHDDPVLDNMIRTGKDLTADVYLAFAYPGGVPDDVDPKDILPDELLGTLTD